MSRASAKKHPFQPNVGGNIRRERRARGWSQVELARRVGVDRNIVQHWEAGRRNPSLQCFEWTCDAFDVTADQLLGRDDG